MSAPVLVALMAALLMGGGAVLMWLGSGGMERRSRVNERLQAWATTRNPQVERRGAARTGIARISWLAPLLQRSGINFTGRLQVILGVIPLLALPLLATFGGRWAALTFVLLYPLALYGMLRWKIRRFARALVGRLPPYLDGVGRSLAVGNSMPIALKLALDQSIEPIPQVFRQVLQRQELGMSIENALEQVAAVYHIRELTLLASAISINSRYGGKLEAVLGNISNSIREYDRAQRELVAMTAETRLSSAILAALPILIAFMITASNPGYIRGMWYDPTGRWLLVGAFFLELTGSIILLRMARV